MGKPSAPVAPTPPSQQEIADATIETAGHMARLQRAMEFGEELLKHQTNEDGSSVRYERVATDIPTGYEPSYSYEDITTSGPSEIVWKGRNAATIKIGSDGKTEKEVVGIPKGTPWNEVAALAAKSKYTDAGKYQFQGTQGIKQTVKTLTGYKSPSGEVITANQYFKIETDKDGNVLTNKDGEPIRELVDRTQAVDVDFTGLGDIDRAIKRWEFEKKTSPEVADHLLRMAKEYGLDDLDFEGGFIDTAIEMLERSDPIGAEVRKLAGSLARDYEPGTLPTLAKLETLVAPLYQERIGRPTALPEIDLKTDLPEYKDAPAFGDLGRLKDEALPTLEELKRKEAPTFGEIGAMAEFGDAPGITKLREAKDPTLLTKERMGEMGTLGRMKAPPTLKELTKGPTFEVAKDLPEELKRLAAFEDLGIAKGMDDLEDVKKMAALAKAGGVPDLEELSIDELALDPESLAKRRHAEQYYADRAEEGRTGRLMAEEARRIARRRAAATGNIFGGGAVIEEARAVRMAEEAGQRQAMGDYMGFLQSGQTAADYEAQVSGENLRRKAMGIEQRGGARQAEFGMGLQKLGADREKVLHERVQSLAGIAQRNEVEEREYQAGLQTLDVDRQAQIKEYELEAQRTSFANEQALREQASRLETMGIRTAAEQAQYGNLQAQLAQMNAAKQAQFSMGTQALGMDQQAIIAEQRAAGEAMGQRTAVQQQEYEQQLETINQQNLARQATFQADIQAAGFDNEAIMRSRVDELGAIAQRTSQEQQDFENLSQIVTQINQTRGGQFGLEAQQLEVNTTQQLRERADELAALGQRNQTQEAEYKALLTAIGQKGQTKQAQFGLDLQGVQQRNIAAESDFAMKQAAMTQRNQAAQQAFQGVMQKTMSEEQLKQQKMANLQSFSGLAPVSGQFNALQGAGSGAGITAPGVQYQPTNVMGLIQGQQQLGQQQFGTQAKLWGKQADLAAAPSGFGQLAGTVAGGWAGSASGGAAITGALKALPIICHTARLVFGEDNPEWVEFYLWKEQDAPKWFRSLYNKYTERIASWLKDKPKLQSIVRNWMRRKING